MVLWHSRDIQACSNRNLPPPSTLSSNRAIFQSVYRYELQLPDARIPTIAQRLNLADYWSQVTRANTAQDLLCRLKLAKFAQHFCPHETVVVLVPLVK